MQRTNATHFGFGRDGNPIGVSSAYAFNVAAPGHATMKCPGKAVVRDYHKCPPEVTGRAPNMWNETHKLYTVWRLQEDRKNNTFLHKCVDAEFPHFPYSHYVSFSALLAMPCIPHLGKLRRHTEAEFYVCRVQVCCKIAFIDTTYLQLL
jgi:hypothetical protein